jgi:hypothetical protein
MNKYGRRASRHWQQHLPTQYAKLRNPEAFFAEMGESLANQIEDLAEVLAGPDQPGESYMDKMGRLNMTRANAEDEVLREMLPEPETTIPAPPAQTNR